MSTNHTPGPWVVTESSDWGGMSGVSLGIDDAFGQDGGRDYHLATVVHGDPGELQANARLVAAAPELLAALDRLVQVLEKQLASPHMAQRKSPLAQARAAIAKATAQEGGAA